MSGRGTVLRRSWNLAIATTIAVLVAGCRTVWVHPDATAEKYAEDIARCKYGLTAAEVNHIVLNSGEALPPHRRNWKQCMQILGWSTETKPRAHPLWDRS